MVKQEISTERNIERVKIYPYEHRCRYYETDAGGNVHQTNYTRWLEDARINLMTQLGFGYRQMEQMQINCPLLTEEIHYFGPIHFDDVIVVQPKITGFDGRKMDLEYTVCDKKTEEVRATAKTSHCFMNRAGIPISISHIFPEIETTAFEFQ